MTRDVQQAVQSPYRCQSDRFLKGTGQCTTSDRGSSSGPSYRYRKHFIARKNNNKERILTILRFYCKRVSVTLVFGRPTEHVNNINTFCYVTDVVDRLDRFPMGLVALVLKVLQREDETPATHTTFLVHS